LKRKNVTFVHHVTFIYFFKDFFLKKDNIAITSKIFNSLILLLLELTEVFKIILSYKKKKLFYVTAKNSHKVKNKVVWFLQLKMKKKFR